MNTSADENLQRLLRLPREMLALANQAEPAQPAVEPADEAIDEPAVFDREQVMEYFGANVELLREVVTIFTQKCPGMIEGLAKALEGGDASEAAAAAHKLQGSLVYFYPVSAAALVREMEETADAGDLDGAGALLPEARVEVERLLAALQRFTAAS